MYVARSKTQRKYIGRQSIQKPSVQDFVYSRLLGTADSIGCHNGIRINLFQDKRSFIRKAGHLCRIPAFQPSMASFPLGQPAASSPIRKATARNDLILSSEKD